MTLQIQILVVDSANDIRWYLVKVLIIITCLSSIQMFRKANDFFLHVVIQNRMIRVVFLFIYQLLKKSFISNAVLQFITENGCLGTRYDD